MQAEGTAPLPTDAGLHRFVWGLRLGGPWDANARRSGFGGPMVPPGRYKATLSADGWSHTVAFQVVMDPRVAAEGISAQDVAAQAQLGVQVRDALSAARAAVARLDDVRESAGGELTPELTKLRIALVTAPVRYSPPKLVDQLQYLYFNLNRADQVPGHDAYARYEELNAELREVLAALREAIP